MWMSAVNVRKKTMKERPELGQLKGLDDLSNVEKGAALEATTNLLKHPNKRRRHGGDFVEQGAGPCNIDELGNEELASYKGKGGGRFWKWYEPGVFEQQLKTLRAEFDTCTERQCVEALRLTHTVLEGRSRVAKEHLVPFSGPQCYPQVKNWKKDGALLRNSVFEQEQKTAASAARAAEVREVTNAPAHVAADLPDQLHDCWMTCELCGARRLVDRWCKAAVDADGYHVDVSAGMGRGGRLDAKGEVVVEEEEEEEEVGQHASRWKGWMAGARARYVACGGVLDFDADVGVDASEDADAQGVVPADVLATVGSYQPRQADGSYLNAEEKSFVAKEVGQAGIAAKHEGAPAAVRF
jgi:hypothetical protein